MTFGFIFQEVSWTPDDSSYSLVTFHFLSQVKNTKYHNPNGLGFQHKVFSNLSMALEAI
jgi:hypothetical protein